jgi:hypothetical protein
MEWVRDVCAGIGVVIFMVCSFVLAGIAQAALT